MKSSVNLNLYQRLRAKSDPHSESGKSAASSGLQSEDRKSSYTSSAAPNDHDTSVKYAHPDNASSRLVPGASSSSDSDRELFAEAPAPTRARTFSFHRKHANSNTSSASTRSSKRTSFGRSSKRRHSTHHRRNSRWSRSSKNKTPYRYIARPGITDQTPPVFPTTFKGWVKHVATHLRRAAKVRAGLVRYYWQNFTYWIKRKLRLHKMKVKVKTAVMDLAERVMPKLHKFSTVAVGPKQKDHCQECGTEPKGSIQKRIRRYSDSASWTWKKVKSLSPKQARNIEEFRRASEMSERLWRESFQT